jgi:hypothetical protein
MTTNPTPTTPDGAHNKTDASVRKRFVERVFILLRPSDWEHDPTRPFLVRGGSFARFGVGGWWGTVGLEVRRPSVRRCSRCVNTGKRPTINTGSSRYLSIKARPGHEVNFGPGYEISSDVAALVYGDHAALIGWGDDYGTVRHPDHDLPPAVKEAAERFIEAASDLWAALPED